MAPLSPSNTARFRFFYTNVAHQHSLEVRSLASPSALGVIVDNFLTALSPLLFATVLDSVTFAVAGSNVFNPVVTGIEGNTYNPSNVGTVASLAANYFNFIGRSSGGRRVRLAVFGSITQGTDYRMIAGESAATDAAVNVLVAASPAIMCIDGLAAIWKSYVNVGVNAYWQKALRP
jgi:hypothetical protein